MDYPDDFETPANPAGKRIAISRTMSIWTSAVFLIIIFLCFIILWSYKSKTLSTVLISVDDRTGAWTVVDRGNNNNQSPVFKTMQEYVVGNFIKNWFNISTDLNENNAIWEKCDRDKCRSDSLMFGTKDCALYCAAGEDVYSKFAYDVLPNYTDVLNSGNSWKIDINSIEILPNGAVTKNGGSWIINATVLTSDGTFKIQAFAKIGLNRINYPHTMGFYVADFNSYRIDK